MTERNIRADASEAGTFQLGGELEVRRLGFGAMRLTGEGIWGEPDDPEEAKAVLRRAVELSVNLIDTADSYGPEVAERLIGETLHPYPENLVIATKGGLTRPGPGQWDPDDRPEHLREALEDSLRRLKLERIDLYQLHRVNRRVPVEESVSEAARMREEGKVRHIGLSEVSVEEIEKAREIVPIASVQNNYNLTNRASEDVLDYCEREGIAFLPFFPLATGSLARPGGPLDEVAARHEAAPSQIALAWLLARSPVILPIPGTSSVAHLQENVGAAAIDLSSEEVSTLSG